MKIKQILNLMMTGLVALSVCTYLSSCNKDNTKTGNKDNPDEPVIDTPSGPYAPENGFPILFDPANANEVPPCLLPNGTDKYAVGLKSYEAVEDEENSFKIVIDRNAENGDHYIVCEPLDDNYGDDYNNDLAIEFKYKLDYELKDLRFLPYPFAPVVFDFAGVLPATNGEWKTYRHNIYKSLALYESQSRKWGKQGDAIRITLNCERSEDMPDPTLYIKDICMVQDKPSLDDTDASFPASMGGSGLEYKVEDANGTYYSFPAVIDNKDPEKQIALDFGGNIPEDRTYIQFEYRYPKDAKQLGALIIYHGKNGDNTVNWGVSPMELYWDGHKEGHGKSPAVEDNEWHTWTIDLRTIIFKYYEDNNKGRWGDGPSSNTFRLDFRQNGYSDKDRNIDVKNFRIVTQTYVDATAR